MYRRYIAAAWTQLISRAADHRCHGRQVSPPCSQRPALRLTVSYSPPSRRLSVSPWRGDCVRSPPGGWRSTSVGLSERRLNRHCADVPHWTYVCRLDDVHRSPSFLTFSLLPTQRQRSLWWAPGTCRHYELQSDLVFIACPAGGRQIIPVLDVVRRRPDGRCAECDFATSNDDVRRCRTTNGRPAHPSSPYPVDKLNEPHKLQQTQRYPTYRPSARSAQPSVHCTRHYRNNPDLFASASAVQQAVCVLRNLRNDWHYMLTSDCFKQLEIERRRSRTKLSIFGNFLVLYRPICVFYYLIFYISTKLKIIVFF